MSDRAECYVSGPVSGRIANCPSCGGQVEFKAGSSLLAICQYCSGVVARVGDDITDLEILGKAAPLAAISSPLYLGIRGRYEGREFALVGRTQLDYGLGPWNEWYAAFDDGRWGWLAEAQGKVYLTFPKPSPGLQPWSTWRVGARFALGKLTMTVTERRKARFVTGEGELPFRVAPGEEFKYVDLEGEGGTFGTLDFGTGDEVETVYLGKEQTYSDLFQAGDLHGVTEPSAPAGALELRCPNCGATVELRAPDEAQTVTCPSCESLLDCQKGSALFLLSSAKRGGLEPKLPLGATGKYKDETWTIYGHLTRSVVVDMVTYYWEEYLLRSEKKPTWRWLVVSNDHWSWVEPVSAGAVEVDGLSAKLKGKAFRHFQSATGKVESIRGEFYWKVKQGETASLADYVAPPLMLSAESTSEETTYSLCTYLPLEEVQKIFKSKQPLPKPSGVAPNQPNPHAAARRALIQSSGVLTIALIVLSVMFSAKASNKLVFEGSYQLHGQGTATDEDIVVSTPFRLDEQANLEVRVDAQVLNAWFYLAGALIDQKSGAVRTFGAEVSNYRGYSGGESWSEGDPVRTVYLGSVAAGDYVLRFEPQWDTVGYNASGAQGLQLAKSYNVKVRSDVFTTSHAVFVWFLLWVLPALQLIRHSLFEKRRWSESDHAPSGGDD